MDVQMFYNKVGADYRDMVRRFRDESRIIKFLSMFAADQSFAQLSRAMEEGDYEVAFRAAHTLKGICMNLGLGNLQESSGALTDNLRGRAVNADTPALLVKTAGDYNEVCNAIDELLNS